MLIRLFFAITTLTACDSHFEYKCIISRYAKKNEVSPQVIYAIVKRESNFNPRAVGKVGERGLGQIRYSMHKKRCGLREPDQLFDRVENIRCVCVILKHYLDRADGDYAKALAFYNAGPSNWRAGIGYSREILELNKGGLWKQKK